LEHLGEPIERREK